MPVLPRRRPEGKGLGAAGAEGAEGFHKQQPEGVEGAGKKVERKLPPKRFRDEEGAKQPQVDPKEKTARAEALTR